MKISNPTVTSNSDFFFKKKMSGGGLFIRDLRADKTEWNLFD